MATGGEEVSAAKAVLSALVATLEMLGFTEVATIVDNKKKQEEESGDKKVQWGFDLYRWATKLYRQQAPHFHRIWLDKREGRGHFLMNLLSWDDETGTRLCDELELNGIVHVTTPLLCELIHAIQCMEKTKMKIGDPYHEPVYDQVCFTNEFLQWQIRFTDLSTLMTRRTNEMGAAS